MDFQAQERVYRTVDEMKSIEFRDTDYGQLLARELDSLVCSDIITKKQSDSIWDFKIKEHVRQLRDENKWEDIKFFLVNFPELFTLNELVSLKEAQKFFLVISSSFEEQLDEIAEFVSLRCEKQQRVLPDGRSITFYVGYLLNDRQYTLEEHPVRKAFSLAEDSGIRIGFYYYSRRDSAFDGLSGIRSFPIVADVYGDGTHSAGGLRKDLGKAFKSSWEANMARLLNHKGLSWQYENARRSYRTPLGYYIPDFLVSREGGEDIIEVKGFWNMRSVLKLDSVLRGQIKERLIIVDADIYAVLSSEYGARIPHWETVSVPYPWFELPVVGVTRKERARTVEGLAVGERLQLVREAQNPYDPHAIRICTCGDSDVGYVAKEWASIFAYKIDFGFQYDIVLKSKDLEKSRLIVKATTTTIPSDILDRIFL